MSSEFAFSSDLRCGYRVRAEERIVEPTVHKVQQVDLHVFVRRVHVIIDRLQEGGPSIVDYVPEDLHGVPEERECRIDLLNFFHFGFVADLVRNLCSVWNISAGILLEISEELVRCIYGYLDGLSGDGFRSMPVSIDIVFLDYHVQEETAYRAGGEQFDCIQSSNSERNAAAMVGVVVEEGPKHICSICLEDICAGETVTAIPCSHVFHGGCIDIWLSIAASCPICRFEMKGL